jgi:ubiquinone/menaquinone biosynthesis C-methylase UbiE
MRPGGLELTSRLLDASSIAPGARLMDVGCGDGRTVKKLLELGYDASGIDSETDADADVCRDLPVKRGSAYDLSCGDSELDGILCECVFSLLDYPAAALTEFKRALRSGGALMISDVYSRASGGKGAGMLKNIYAMKEIDRLLLESGFLPEYFEDHSAALKEMFAQLVFDMGSGAFYKEINMDFERLKKLECGYFLLGARSER